MFDKPEDWSLFMWNVYYKLSALHPKEDDSYYVAQLDRYKINVIDQYFYVIEAKAMLMVLKQPLAECTLQSDNYTQNMHRTTVEPDTKTVPASNIKGQFVGNTQKTFILADKPNGNNNLHAPGLNEVTIFTYAVVLSCVGDLMVTVCVDLLPFFDTVLEYCRNGASAELGSMV